MQSELDLYREKVMKGEKLDKDQKVWLASSLLVSIYVLCCMCWLCAVWLLLWHICSALGFAIIVWYVCLLLCIAAHESDSSFVLHCCSIVIKS